MLILRPAWLHTARQPYLVSVTPAALGDFPPHVCVSRLFSVCAKGKKKWCVQLVLANLKTFPACHCRCRVQVWKDEAQHLGGGPGSWQVSGDEGRKEVKVVRGSERSARGFFSGGSLSILFCFPLLLCSHRCPETEIQAPGISSTNLWGWSHFGFKTCFEFCEIWVSCSPFHLCLYSLFLTIHNKTWSQELEDKLVCQSWLTLEAHWC